MSMFSLRPALKAVVHTHPEEEVTWEDSTKSLALDASSSQYAQATSLAFDPGQAYSVSLWYFSPALGQGDSGGLFTDGTGHAWFSHRLNIYLSYSSASHKERIIATEGEGDTSSTRTDLIFKASAPTSPSSFINLQVHEWHHVVFTSTSTSSAAGTIKLYWDGEEVKSGTGKAYGGSNYQTKPTLGAFHVLGQTPLTGNIDQVAIYQRTLSASDVTALYGTSRKPQTPYLSSGDPIHLWAMGENATGSTMPDQIGSLDMTLYNSPTVSTDVAPAPWAARWSTKFDGADDYFTGGCPVDVTGAFSVSLWIKFGVGATLNQHKNIFWLYDSSLGSADFRLKLAMHRRSTTHRFDYWVSDGAGSSASTDTYVTSADVEGVWAHVVLTCSATSSATGDTKFYMNGAHLDTHTGTPALDASASINAFILGGPSNYFPGSMTESSCWNRVLSATEVTNLYNSGNPTDPMNTTGVTADAVAYYRLGDRWNQGTVPDVIGSNDLTMSSAPVPEEDVPFKNTYSMALDGTDERLESASGGGVSIDSSAPEFSVSVWAKFPTDPNGGFVVSSSVPGSSYKYPRALIKADESSGTYIFGAATSSGGGTGYTSFTVDTGQDLINTWCHLVYTDEGDGSADCMKLYLNLSLIHISEPTRPY